MTEQQQTEKPMRDGCQICGRESIYHGSEHERATPGTYLSEAGCHNGVFMDDDEYTEGWDPDVVHPPCPYNPEFCTTCTGTGRAPPVFTSSDDCPDCEGTGWKGGKHKQPDDRYAQPKP